jgi:hypothetical protein
MLGIEECLPGRSANGDIAALWYVGKKSRRSSIGSTIMRIATELVSSHVGKLTDGFPRHSGGV